MCQSKAVVQLLKRKNKLHYIHNNPVQEKWKLATVPEYYRRNSVLLISVGGTATDKEKDLLGHFNLKTTERYLHVSKKQLINIISPFDDLWKNEQIEW